MTADAKDTPNKEQGVDEVDETLATEQQADEPRSHAETAGEQAEATELSELEQLQQQLAESEQQVAQMKDQMLRDHAETQNIRKRLQRDVENARKFALEKFVTELLPVLDNLERSIEAVGDDENLKPFREGVELTYKSFLDALEKFNVKQIDPVGEPFDANFHQAMTMVPNPDMEPNSVMDCMQKGYTLNDRLLRAAMVVVSKEA